jgi:hypothetical protein
MLLLVVIAGSVLTANLVGCASKPASVAPTAGLTSARLTATIRADEPAGWSDSTNGADPREPGHSSSTSTECNAVTGGTVVANLLRALNHQDRAGLMALFPDDGQWESMEISPSLRDSIRIGASAPTPDRAVVRDQLEAILVSVRSLHFLFYPETYSKSGPPYDSADGKRLGLGPILCVAYTVPDATGRFELLYGGGKVGIRCSDRKAIRVNIGLIKLAQERTRV